MPRRKTVPLYKTRHAAFIEAINEADDPDRAMASHLAVGTGARADTICHTHSSWFRYKRDGSLYYKVPSSDPCRKGMGPGPCGDCRQHDHDSYKPKTPAGEGREILLTNEWTNPVTREKEYFGLKDRVESYFALDGTHAPQGVQHGNNLIQGNGISNGTLNEWIREIAAQSSISATLREDRLREVITVRKEKNGSQIVSFGTDSDGNEIPDIITHDMRATYCTQLMRNDVPRTKAINKTGHARPSSMEPYVNFAEDEIDASEEATFY